MEQTMEYKVLTSRRTIKATQTENMAEMFFRMFSAHSGIKEQSKLVFIY